MEEIPVIQIYLWGNLVGAMSWDDERGYADFQFDDRFRRSGLDIAPLMMPLAVRNQRRLLPSMKKQEKCVQARFLHRKDFHIGC